MVDIKNIFTVIDPTTDKQYALERAMRIAKITDARIHAYLCMASALETHDPEALQRVELSRCQLWLDQLLEKPRAEGFKIDSEIEWNIDWRSAIGKAARKAKSDFIVKSSRRRSTARRLMMTSSDLALLNMANCPIQFVSSEVKGDLHKVLMAVDTRREDGKYQEILDAVIEFGNTVANTNENGELHAVYAYSDSESFQHVTDIAKRVDLHTDFVHVTGGDPEHAIAEVADRINADIIIIGLSTRSTLSNRLLGNMIDRLLNNLDHDILVVVPKES